MGRSSFILVGFALLAGAVRFRRKTEKRDGLKMKRNWMTVLALTSALLAGPVRAEEDLPTNVTALQVELLKQQIEVVRATREKREMEAEVIRVRDELRVTTEKADRGAAQSQSLAKQLADAQRNRAEAEKAQSAAETAAKQANERAQKLEATVKKLEADLRKAYKDIADRTESIQRQETALSVEKTVSETAVKRANELKQALADTRKELADSQKGLAEAQKQCADAGKELADVRAAQKEQAEKMASSASAYDAAVKSLAEADKAKAALEGQLRELQVSVEQQRTDAEARLAEQKQAYADLAAKLTAEQQALQLAQAEIAQLKARQDGPAAQPEVPAEQPAAETPAQPEAPAAQSAAETPAQPEAPAAQPAAEAPVQPAEPQKTEPAGARPTPPQQADLAALLDSIPPPPPVVPTPAGAPGSIQITPAR